MKATSALLRKMTGLGIGPDGIQVVTQSMSQALCELVETLSGDDHELLTLIEGEGATPKQPKSFKTWVAANRPGLEVDVQKGGQALYPYFAMVVRRRHRKFDGRARLTTKLESDASRVFGASAEGR